MSTSSITGSSCGSRASAFLATHGPTKTQRTSSPYSSLTASAVATIGETIGTRRSTISGWYLRTYSATAGQAVAMCTPVGFASR